MLPVGVGASRDRCLDELQSAASLATAVRGRAMQTGDRSSLFQCKVLEGVSEEVVLYLESLAEWRFYETGEKLCEQGDTAADFMFLVSGQVRVLIRTAAGREVDVSDIAAGGHIGEVAVIDGGARSATVVAVVPSTVAAVDLAVMRQIIRAQSAVAINLLGDFARILRRANERVVDLSTKSDIQRVYDELLRLAEPLPSGDGTWYIPVFPVHKELAARADTTTETVARIIGQLTAVGIVRRHNRSLHITDRRHIEKRANGNVVESG